jgi:hypothetical protein
MATLFPKSVTYLLTQNCYLCPNTKLSTFDFRLLTFDFRLSTFDF